MRYGLLGFDFQISIHALREEGDPKLSSRWTRPTNFYPRPPRGGRQPLGLIAAQKQTISIHALREEGDRFHSGTLTAYRNFYPRPPRGGRPFPRAISPLESRFLSTPSARRATKGRTQNFCFPHISIHALREEGDNTCRSCRYLNSGFLSTPSARRATFCQPCRQGGQQISIHALREEGDAGV